MSRRNDMSHDGGDDRGSEDGEDGEKEDRERDDRDPDNRDSDDRDPDDQGRGDRDSEQGDQAAERDDERDRPAADAVSLSLDETLEILANYERRHILGYLMNAPDATATVDELVEHLLAQQSDADARPGRGHVTTTLHHVHLPKLADAGVVDYDPRSQEVRYWSDDRLEEWLDCIRGNG